MILTFNISWVNEPALWSMIGVLIGGITSGIINYCLQISQFNHQKEMFFLTNKSKEEVKEILNDLLEHRTQIERSFEAIRNRIGGYTNYEIRKLLHEVGATLSSRKDGPGEWWILKERKQELLAKKISKK